MWLIALKFFPEELLGVLDTQRKYGTGKTQRAKAQRLGSLGREREEVDEEAEAQVEKAETNRPIDSDDDDEELEERSDNQSETFSDEDDEMGEDYNAEKYFDTGEDVDVDTTGDGDDYDF